MPLSKKRKKASTKTVSNANRTQLIRQSVQVAYVDGYNAGAKDQYDVIMDVLAKHEGVATVSEVHRVLANVGYLTQEIVGQASDVMHG